MSDKGFSVSDNSTPPTFGQQPPAPGQPTQAYPGAAPSFPPAPYTAQVPGAYGSSVPSGYVAPAGQGYDAALPQSPADARYAPYYAAPRPTSGLAITSLVCGIVGVVFGTFLFWIIVPFIASIVAIITGHVALRKTKADPSIGGRGMAFAGLIMGYAMTVVQIIFGAVILLSFLFLGAFTLPFVFSS